MKWILNPFKVWSSYSKLNLSLSSQWCSFFCCENQDIFIWGYLRTFRVTQLNQILMLKILTFSFFKKCLIITYLIEGNLLLNNPQAWVYNAYKFKGKLFLLSFPRACNQCSTNYHTEVYIGSCSCCCISLSDAHFNFFPFSIQLWESGWGFYVVPQCTTEVKDRLFLLFLVPFEQLWQ